MACYVEKYYNENSYYNGEMSSCKKFENYSDAELYFDHMRTKYKRGYLVLSEEHENGFPMIVKEVLLNPQK